MSLAHAKLLASSGKYDSVIYINLPFSRRRFTEAREKAIGGKIPGTKMHIYHIASGHLAQTVKNIGRDLDRPERTALIVNSWEMASSTYRYREDLIFALYNLAFEHELSVFVYSLDAEDDHEYDDEEEMLSHASEPITVISPSGECV